MTVHEDGSCCIEINSLSFNESDKIVFIKKPPARKETGGNKLEL